MTVRNILLVCCSAAFGAVFVILVGIPSTPVAHEKSARLSGAATETAFLPERFGVPHPTR